MISIVIPAYNEEENVIPLFKEIITVMTKEKQVFEVIFIDDGSRDNTLENLKTILSNNETKNILRILELQRNYGQTAALLAGFTHAKGELIITMDGDRQNDPNDIPKLIEALTNNYDVICGWRKNRKDNLLKKIPSRINNRLNRRMNNLKIHDSGCTLRIYRRKAIEDLQLFTEGHRYIPAILSYQGFRIGEIITNHRPRLEGKTKYGMGRLFRGFIDLMTLNALNKWGKKPMHLFSRWSLLFFLVSILSFCWVIFERFAFFRFWSYYTYPVSIKTNSIFFISFALFIGGIFILLLGLIAEILLRNNYDAKNSYKIKNEWN
ncbi:MAG: glycosyltransferase family 2 protein [Candidatus Heimdallarchaeota archaeon]|nr:glycosyltransferase family 2 protein [Candidatus Heimdallarchaeota archaeon]